VLWDDPIRYYAPQSNEYYDQGDVVVAPVSVLDDRPEGVGVANPQVGQSVRREYWTPAELGCQTTGEALLGPAMIVSHGCSLDKEFNRRVETLRAGGMSKRKAVSAAAGDDGLDRLITIAPIVPLADAEPADPGSLRRNHVIGYFPVCGSDERAIDEGVVDLLRHTTIDRAVIVDRLGIVSDEARATLLYALARYWAYRAPRLTYEIEEAVGKRIIHADVASRGDLGVVLMTGPRSWVHLL